MDKYYVNNRRQDSDNNNNEVHKEGCYWLSLAKDVTYLGEFYSCDGAMVEARKKYPYSADGCETCCKNCHHG